jgi:hypothetical protein
MEDFSKSEKVFINVGPPGNPYAKIMRTERRLGLKDRRRLNTYIANDRRGGFPAETLPVCYYLYSFEGALSDKHWDDIGEKRKRELKEKIG